MKRTLALVLALCMVLGLAACGQKAPAETQVTAATEAAVMKALRWLKATQEPDGSWGAGRACHTSLPFCSVISMRPRQRR